MISIIICFIYIQVVSAQSLIGQGIYLNGHGQPAGSWEEYDNGIMYVWVESDVYKLTFCQQIRPPYDYTWERYVVNAGEPTNEMYWVPLQRGVGMMADDPTVVGLVEDEGYTYCWYSGPKYVGYGWAPYPSLTRGVDWFTGGADNTLYAALPDDRGDYGGDINNCGLCTGKDIMGNYGGNNTGSGSGGNTGDDYCEWTKLSTSDLCLLDKDDPCRPKSCPEPTTTQGECTVSYSNGLDCYLPKDDPCYKSC